MVDGRRTVNPIHKKRRGFESLLSHSRHISTYMNQHTIYPLQRWWCWDWNMGRDALKLGMIQGMILYCAQILYLKCIFGTKSRFGRSFPHMLANKKSHIRLQTYIGRSLKDNQAVIRIYSAQKWLIVVIDSRVILKLHKWISAYIEKKRCILGEVLMNVIHSSNGRIPFRRGGRCGFESHMDN